MGGWGGYAARQAAGLAVPLTFLKYSRDFEREADRLGVQYLYQAGYDPAALVDFFEKLEALEKERPGTMAGLFRSHPVAAERITRTQKNFQKLVAGRAEFVVTTSEFGDVRGRLEKLLSRRKSDPREESGPVLRRGGRTPSLREEAATGRDQGSEDGERPTLRRQPQSGGV
jgi:predicted Zn-dependent protease